jgi:hypothetical protein
MIHIVDHVDLDVSGINIVLSNLEALTRSLDLNKDFFACILSISPCRLGVCLRSLDHFMNLQRFLHRKQLLLYVSLLRFHNNSLVASTICHCCMND